MLGLIASKFRENKEEKNALYGSQIFDSLRQSEFSRLDNQGHVYLDYTGGGLYSKSQLTAHHNRLISGIYGNPHSQNPSSSRATNLTEKTRKHVLEFFNASKDYYCVFTQNASHALKIVGESYPFDANSHFALLADNHNSVNGIREFAIKSGAQLSYCPVKSEDLTIDDQSLEEIISQTVIGHKLFAFPGQSNVSGVKHSLQWIQLAQEKGWEVLLDAAALAPGSTLDLSKHPADFVSLSFYKMFGYPTGLGALIVKKEKLDMLTKRWFAGGTVSLASVKANAHYLLKNHERFEDGTINYLGIPAVSDGLDFIESIGMDKISKRIYSLSSYLTRHLRSLKHLNGRPMVQLYGPQDRSACGGTVLMNFCSNDGQIVPFIDIERLASKANISIRTGCFCNPGLDEINSNISHSDLNSYFQKNTYGDYHHMMSCIKMVRGAVRVSVGIATNKRDLDTFIRFVKDFHKTNVR